MLVIFVFFDIVNISWFVLLLCRHLPECTVLVQPQQRSGSRVEYRPFKMPESRLAH